MGHNNSKNMQSNLVIRKVLIRNKLVLRNHYSWPDDDWLHKGKEHLALRNNFRMTKKFLITKFDCIIFFATKFESKQSGRWILNFVVFSEYQNIWRHIGCILDAINSKLFSEKNVIQIQKIYVNFKRQKDDTTRVWPISSKTGFNHLSFDFLLL